MCPKGDDPMTENQNYRSIQLSVSSTSELRGILVLTFQDEPSFINLNTRSSFQCEAAMEANPKFKDVSCELLEFDSSSVFYNITILEWPTYPSENNFYFHNGNPGDNEFLCDTTMTSGDVNCRLVASSDNDVRGIQHAVNFMYLEYFQ